MKKIHPVSVYVLIVLLCACNLPNGKPINTLPIPEPTPMPTIPVTQELPTRALQPKSEATLASTGEPLPSVNFQPGEAENTFWVTNPSSGAELYVQVFYPNDWNGSTQLPTLVLMPGGIAESDPVKGARLSSRGYTVIIFDADGRGKSQGTEDFNGFITQDGLAAVILACASLPGVDTDRYGLVSYSYGVTAASGALARHIDLPIDFYIDWEGPVDRIYTTVGCPPNPHGDIAWQPCADDAWWSEREAVNFIGSVRVPYQRVQSQDDHVQPTNDHAIDIINAALAGGVPWVRLNDYPPNQSYEKTNPPVMIPESMDNKLEQIVTRYAEDILSNVLP